MIDKDTQNSQNLHCTLIVTSYKKSARLGLSPQSEDLGKRKCSLAQARPTRISRFQYPDSSHLWQHNDNHRPVSPTAHPKPLWKACWPAPHLGLSDCTTCPIPGTDKLSACDGTHINYHQLYSEAHFTFTTEITYTIYQKNS